MVASSTAPRNASSRDIFLTFSSHSAVSQNGVMTKQFRSKAGTKSSHFHTVAIFSSRPALAVVSYSKIGLDDGFEDGLVVVRGCVRRLVRGYDCECESGLVFALPLMNISDCMVASNAGMTVAASAISMSLLSPTF